MRRVLNNDTLEEKFQKDGFIKVPFISKEEVAELTQLFFDTLPESGGQITANDIGSDNIISYDFTFIDKNPEYKRKVFKLISERFAPHMNRVLHHYRPIIANYIRKKPAGGEVPLHQNWAFADERKCTTVSIWCPLVDSTIENGTLQFVPGSHKRFGEFRGPLVPSELNEIHNEIIEKYLVPVETEAGDCIILDDSIIHYSAINKTQGLRLAIQLICVPEEEPSIHFHLNPQENSNEIQMLKVEDSFYMEFNPWMKPKNVSVIKHIPFQASKISESDFAKALKKPRFDAQKPNFIETIKRVFSLS